MIKIKLSKLEDVHQTPQYAQFMKKINWQVIRLATPQQTINVFIKKLPFLPFSILKILRYQPPLSFAYLKKIVKKNHVFLIKLQPFSIKNYSVLNPYYSFKNDNFPLLPTKTIWIDLNQTEESLLKKMKPKTRYNLKKALHNFPKPLIISGKKITKQQLKEFHQLWSKNKPFNFLFKPSFYELKSLVASFGKKCFFVLVYQNHYLSKKLMAGCLVLTSKNMAHYWHNFATLEAKKLFAPTLYVWTAIKEAQKLHLKIFDFEGIWDERLPHFNRGWLGFSRFKKSFGGEIIDFAWPQKALIF